MFRVSVEVRSNAACLSVSVRGPSIRQAVSMVKALYPGADARVVLPIEPATFFVADTTVLNVKQVRVPESGAR